MVCGIGDGLFVGVASKGDRAIACAVQACQEARSVKRGQTRVTRSRHTRRQHKWPAVFIVRTTASSTRGEIRIRLGAGVWVWHIQQEKTKVVVAGVGIDEGDEFVTNRANVAHAQKRIGSELALHRKVKMFRIGQAILVKESNFGVSVEWFEGRELKRFLSSWGHGNNVREHWLRDAGTIAIPEQTGRNVADFLELAQVLEGGVKNSRAYANAGFPRSTGQF